MHIFVVDHERRSIREREGPIPSFCYGEYEGEVPRIGETLVFDTGYLAEERTWAVIVTDVVRHIHGFIDKALGEKEELPVYVFVRFPAEVE